MRKAIWVCLLALCLPNFASAQQISITEHSSFHRTTWGQYGNLENVSGDAGGVLTFFVQNENAFMPDSLINVRFSFAGVYYDSVYWRVWPSVMSPAGQGNNFCTITAKGMDFPFRENDSLTIEAWSARGGYDKISSFTNITPEVRIGNVLPSQDKHTLYIYLRNDGSADYRLERLRLNEKIFVAGITNALNIAGNDKMIRPKEIRILQLRMEQPVQQCEPLALAVQTTRISDNRSFWTSAGIRVVDAEFALGTWHSPLFDNDKEEDRKKMRQLNITSVHGPGNPALMQDAFSEYFMRVIWQPHFGNPFDPQQGAVLVQANSAADYVHAWSVGDEPDLNGKDIAEQLLRNQTYWKNDPNTPSYVNLAVQKKFNRYGWFSDIVGMDHYAAPSAPNIIELTWVPVIGRAAEIAEALEYTEQLKRNTEPRRMWSWCQLADGAWSRQPVDYAVNFQFWAHIAGGAKTMEWFTAKPQHNMNYQEQWAEALRLTKQFSPIKNLCLYSEPADAVTTGNSEVIARTLVGQDAMVVMVLNNTIAFTWAGGLSTDYNSSVDSVSYSVEFTLPAWIPDDEIFKITESGKTNSEFVHTRLGSGSHRITSASLYKQSHVYIIGKTDNIPPDEITRIVIADTAECTLSWQEPYDNYGIQGYIVKYSGEPVDTVHAPIYIAQGNQVCDTSLWEVIAFDASGNLSTDTISSVIYPADSTHESMRMFPNPASDRVHIIFSNVTQVSVAMFDLSGKVLLEMPFTGSEAVIDVSRFSSGLYLISIRTASGSRTVKFSKL